MMDDETEFMYGCICEVWRNAPEDFEEEAFKELEPFGFTKSVKVSCANYLLQSAKFKSNHGLSEEDLITAAKGVLKHKPLTVSEGTRAVAELCKSGKIENIMKIPKEKVSAASLLERIVHSNRTLTRSKVDFRVPFSISIFRGAGGTPEFEPDWICFGLL